MRGRRNQGSRSRGGSLRSPLPHRRRRKFCRRRTGTCCRTDNQREAAVGQLEELEEAGLEAGRVAPIAAGLLVAAAAGLQNAALDCSAAEAMCWLACLQTRRPQRR